MVTIWSVIVLSDRKTMKKVVIIVCLILLQFAWIATVLFKFSYTYTYVNYGIRFIAVCVVIYIINQWNNPSSKLSWTFLILLSPVLGLLLYLTFVPSFLFVYRFLGILFLLFLITLFATSRICFVDL